MFWFMLISTSIDDCEWYWLRCLDAVYFESDTIIAGSEIKIGLVGEEPDTGIFDGKTRREIEDG